MDPLFLQAADVLRLHRQQIERFGGRPEIRDVGLLQSAIAQPQATFGGKFLLADIYEMAAAYLFHISSNHPFVDGNKRTAVASAAVFLATNGYRIIANESEFEVLVMSVARGESQKPKIAQFFRDNVEV